MTLAVLLILLTALIAYPQKRDRRDGERVSFLTSNNRENLDSEICERLRQQVGDAGHASSSMHTASETQVQLFNLTPKY